MRARETLQEFPRQEAAEDAAQRDNHRYTHHDSGNQFFKILGVNWWEVANLGRSSWKEGKYKFVHEVLGRTQGTLEEGLS